MPGESCRGPRKVSGHAIEDVGGLWHFGSLRGKKRVLTRDGWRVPTLFNVLDDHSWLACHAQWYLADDPENAVDTLMRAMQKRGLPHAVMTDNCAPMNASEITRGLAALKIEHQTMLPFCPYQFAKQERFASLVERSLPPMLESVTGLSLELLNDVTSTWLESEYNCRPHSTMGTTPIDRFLTAPVMPRVCPDPLQLKLAFTRADRPRVRKSDGTVSVAGVRFGVPEGYRDRTSIEVRYARWDLTFVHMIDVEAGAESCRLMPCSSKRT